MFLCASHFILIYISNIILLNCMHCVGNINIFKITYYLLKSIKYIINYNIIILYW